MAAWHDAQRMQLERVHLQGSLLEDPPVLIPAFPLPGVTNGGSDLPAGLLPAGHNNNGPGRKPERASATGASQETS